MTDATISGSLTDTHIRDLRRSQAESQTSFNDFDGGTDSTYVAVTRNPEDDMREIADEICEDLAPPRYLLNEFLETKDDILYRNDIRSTEAHNRAWHEVEMPDRFERYLWWDDSDTESYELQQDGHEPSHHVIDLAERVYEGEHVVLVCYCGRGKVCHRWTVRGEIERWMELIVRVEEADDSEEWESFTSEEVAERLGLDFDSTEQQTFEDLFEGRVA